MTTPLNKYRAKTPRLQVQFNLSNAALYQKLCDAHGGKFTGTDAIKIFEAWLNTPGS